MNKIVLTGFNCPLSPIGNIIEGFKKNVMISQVEIIYIILPCEYFKAFKILSDVMDKEKPDAIISIGLPSKIQKIRIETVFINLMNGHPDAIGYHPTRVKISEEENAKEFLASQTNNLFLANRLHLEKIPVELSASAGTCIYNSLGYSTTKKIMDNDLPIRNMFINVPFTSILEKEKLYKAIELMVLNIC